MRDSFDILLLPGDGIGPEVIGAARAVMDVAAAHLGVEMRYEERKIGGAALRDEGEPVSDETLEAAKSSDSVLLGAVGHPDFDDAPVRPEAPPETKRAGPTNLLLRQGLGLRRGR